MLYVTVLCFPIFIGGLSRQLAPSTSKLAMQQTNRNSRATPIGRRGARRIARGATPAVEGANWRATPPMKMGKHKNVMG